MKLVKILIYPIKSLDPVEVKNADFTSKGSLLHDREFALFDEEGRVVNAKREKRLHSVRAVYDLNAWKVKLKAEEHEGIFSLDDLKGLSDFFSEFLGLKVYVRRYEEGFPDDRKAHGPTLVSRSSLEEVARWFSLDLENVRRRFRANLEIDAPPFWEDTLVGKTFKIGNATLVGENISKRCPVPTRDPFTGVPIRGFVETFIEKRKEALRPDVDLSVFPKTMYRLCLNTNVKEPAEIKVGDPVNYLH